jgi:restriction endonuclease S subunit
MREGWEIKKIGEVCDLMTGGTPSKSKSQYFNNGDVKWLVSGDIHKQEIFDCDGRITKEGLENSNAKYLPLNSVLIALNGQGKTRGTVALLRTKATCNQSLVSIYPKKGIEILPEYIYCNLHGRYEELRKLTGDTGNDRRGLNMPLIRNLNIPIAPLPEQKHIVEILDKAFAAIDKAKANVEKNLQNAKELFESYLQEAFTTASRDSKTVSLGEVCYTSGRIGWKGLTAKEYTKTGPLFLSVHSLNYGDYVDFRDAFHISQARYDESPEIMLQEGDVLICKDGAGIGKLGMVGKFSEQVTINSSLLLIRPNNNLSTKYLYYNLLSHSFQGIVKSRLQGATTPHLYQRDIVTFPILLPSKSKQDEIVFKLESLSEEIIRLQVNYKQKLDDFEELKKSVLQKAFAGKLNADVNKKQIVKVSPTDLQAAIISLALQKHQDKKTASTFGHVKSEKIVNTAQYYLNLDLDRNPIKDAAGPNDFSQLKKVESRAQKAGFFSVNKINGRHEYKIGNQANVVLAKGQDVLGQKWNDLEKLIDVFVPMDTQQAEIVATVFAAWNNLLIDKRPITDEAIVYEARENWHKSKLNIERDRFFKALEWMKQKGLVPKGTGKKVLSKQDKS